jgi:YesN/AraC family two-component response regulator
VDAKRQIKVLVVEDEILVAKSIEMILKSWGCDVVGTASSGEKAIEITSYAKPDLVLMDIKLKGPMDGVSTAQRIQTFFDIPVVYLTAHSDPETLKRALHSNPYGYLVKPFVEKELHQAISHALDRHRAKRRIKGRD